MPASPSPTPPVPSRLRRFACMMYEGVLLFGVLFLASYLLDTLTQSREALTLRHARQGVAFLAIGLYFILCWRHGGQTLPMKTWDIRLIGQDRAPVPLSRMLLRYLLMWPLPLLAAWLVSRLSAATGYASMDLLIVAAPFSIFIWTWFDPQGQFLHDRLLGTRLVDLKATAQP
ncbi:RDD family protein [Castellaniella sp. GW247-6E4]|uniref:RDD family protein n=1 Tax=Castellaniella sp. GW247-6E4 TaxID=3140380 RepID=UPI003314A69A